MTPTRGKDDEDDEEDDNMAFVTLDLTGINFDDDDNDEKDPREEDKDHYNIVKSMDGEMKTPTSTLNTIDRDALKWEQQIVFGDTVRINEDQNGTGEGREDADVEFTKQLSRRRPGSTCYDKPTSLTTTTTTRNPDERECLQRISNIATMILNGNYIDVLKSSSVEWLMLHYDCSGCDDDPTTSTTTTTTTTTIYSRIQSRLSSYIDSIPKAVELYRSGPRRQYC